MKHTYCLLSIFFLCQTLGAQVYFLNGTTTYLGGDCYRLTTEATYQNGTVWYGDQIDLTQPFDIQFTMNFGTLDGNGADGIVFVLQTVGTSAIGESGGGLGYANFGTSLGIEFDTWQNGNYNDPGYDHIAIVKNGDINHNSSNNIAGPVQANVFNQNIEDGQNHTVRITWNPDTQVIQVFFDCVFRLSGQQNLINQIFGGQSLVYWGFTAATGGAYNNQTVCLQPNILSVGDQVTICSGMSTTLSAGSSLDGVYNWSPADFLDNPSSATPTAAPTQSTTYTVTFTDLCNNPVQATIQVFVVDLEVTVSGEPQINCINPTAEYSSQINFSADVNYTWSSGSNTLQQGLNISNFSTANPGTYQVMASVQGVCFAETEFTVTSDFSVHSADAGMDQTINCATPTVTLAGVTNAQNAAQLWLQGGQPISGSTDGVIEITVPGTFTYQVTHLQSGCRTEDQVTVGQDFSTPAVTLGMQDTLTCLRPSLAIENLEVASIHPVSYQWSTTDGNFVSSTTLANASINAPGTYNLAVTDVNTGCTTEAQTTVVRSELFGLDLSSLTFPNIITPNGDGKNEVWKPYLSAYPEVKLSELFDVFKLRIFNRWGNLMFESNSASGLWSASNVEKGVYYYTLTYQSNCSTSPQTNAEGYIHIVD